MAAHTNQSDLILVNCQEIPETICVETRLITQSGKQKNVEHVLFSNNGSLELIKEPITSARTVPSVCKTPSVMVSIKPKPVSVGSSNVASTAVQQCQLPQPAQRPNSFASVALPLTNLINNTSNNLSTVNDLLIPAVATQLNNTLQLPSFNLNNAVLPIPQLASGGFQNVSNVMQQTELSAFNTNSVGIQCILDDELEDMDVEWPTISRELCENHEDTEDEMVAFLKFIKDNSAQHKNYKECLICGEVCKSNKYFYGHMAVHRGPKALCFKCGQCLEHKNLLDQHKCQQAKQLAKAILKCPHYSCDVTAISLLELYDHINEHSNNDMYKCSACRKGFCTGQEYLRHILIRAKCYTSAKRKRFRLYDLESQRDRYCRVRVFTLHTYRKCTTMVKTFLTQRTQKKGVCKICFKSLKNHYTYSRHRRACVTRFKKRLLKKKFKN